MATFHLSIKYIGRSTGRSATAAAAYRSAERIRDERTGELHDYGRKRGIVHREILAPEEAPPWARLRTELWNAAEQRETRKNSITAREFEVSLPAELPKDARTDLARELAREIVARHKVAVDLAVHAPGRGGDSRNHHAHLLLTTRRLDATGLTEKTRELQDYTTGEVGYWRERWATLQNDALKEHGLEARVDHRSFKERGVTDREPTQHKGPVITAIERRGGWSYVAERMREEANERLARAAELGRVERAQDAEAALRDRRLILPDERTPTLELAAPPRTSEEIRKAAREAWLAQRAAQRSPDATRTIDLSAAHHRASPEREAEPARQKARDHGHGLE